MAVTANITVQLIANLLATEDSTGSVVVNRGTGNPSVDCKTCQYIQQFQTAGAGVDTNLPITIACDVLYLRNLDTSALINVRATAVAGGGAQTIMIVLRPGAQIIFFEPTTGAGWTNVTVASSTGSTGVEALQAII